MKRSPEIRPAVLAALLFALAPAIAAGQTISGVVLDDGSGDAIPGVEIRLLDAAGDPRDAGVSGDAGEFTLSADRSGTYILEAARLGYAPVRSDSIAVAPGEHVRVEIRMAVAAIAVEPVVVKSRGGYGNQDISGFYRRLEYGRRSGLGHFVSRAEIEDRHAIYTSDLLRAMPGVRVVRGRAGFSNGVRMTANCIPAIYVDGTWVNRFGGDSLDEFVSPMILEGLEVYRGPQVGPYYDPRGCGLILAWTRRGEYVPSDEPFPWVKVTVGFGLMGLLLLLR